jgi:DMSO/TMAO reductase YedYZ molybdopterin-dependent catalytic subunit
MLSRRAFLYILGAGPLLKIERTWAVDGRTIVPRGARLEDLVNKNPADLDTANLEATPIEKFGVMGLDDYEASLDDWRLVVDGNIHEPLTLKYQEILELSVVEKTVLLICPGFFACNGLWKGISMKGLLKRAQLKSEKGYVVIRGPEGKYEKTEKFLLSEVMEDKVFLAYQVNGIQLPRKHGFPLRVVAQDHYGSEWVKYVYKVTVQPEMPVKQRS